MMQRFKRALTRTRLNQTSKLNVRRLSAQKIVAHSQVRCLPNAADPFGAPLLIQHAIIWTGIPGPNFELKGELFNAITELTLRECFVQTLISCCRTARLRRSARLDSAFRNLLAAPPLTSTSAMSCLVTRARCD